MTIVNFPFETVQENARRDQEEEAYRILAKMNAGILIVERESAVVTKLYPSNVEPPCDMNHFDW